MYSTGDVASRFGKNASTIRRWTEEFSEWLSSGANPDGNQHRQFIDTDLEVFAVVHNTKNSGGTFEDAKAKLRSGQRDEIPNKPLSDEQMEMVVSRMAQELQAKTELVEELQMTIDRLQEQLSQAQQETSSANAIGNRVEDELTQLREKYEALLREKIRLEITLEMKD